MIYSQYNYFWNEYCYIFQFEYYYNLRTLNKIVSKYFYFSKSAVTLMKHDKVI